MGTTIPIISWLSRQIPAATFLVCLLSNFAIAQGIPNTLGWYQIPNSTIRSVCASKDGFNVGDCANVTAAWNSGVFDTTRNRLIIWGGGHTDYYGNEIYTLNLNTLTVERLTNPGLPTASSCVEAIANGTQPNSRHTYDGIEYMANGDRMFVFSGSLACSSGNFSSGTWTYDFSAARWQLMNPSGPNPTAGPGRLTAYDPNTGKVFVHDETGLYSYDLGANSYTRHYLGNSIGYHMAATIDPVRKKFIIVGYDNVQGGGRVHVYDIGPGSTYQRQTITTTGATGIVGQNYIGVDYDPVQDRIVAWDGGNTAYLLDTSNWNWSSVSYSGGPSAMTNGTNGRFRYSPALNLFAICNSVDSNCYALRLTSDGSVPPPAAPTVSIVANPTSVSSGSAATLTWSSTNATSCTASGGWSGSKTTSGSQSTGNLTANTVFTLTCTGSGGSATQSANVTVASSTAPPPPSTGSSVLLVKFGKSSTLSTFGLTGWSTVIKDIYTDYQDLGPGGTTIIVGNNYAYNYQGVTGSPRNFVSGEKIRVTWYNNSSTAVSFTPNISFTSADRIIEGTGTWYPMTSVTVPSFGSAISEYTFSSATAGSYSLVNVNVNYSNTQVIVADKIELLPVGSSSSPSFDFSLSNGGNKSVTQGQSISNNIAVNLVSGTAQGVTFSTLGLPLGAVASFLPTSCSPTCSTAMAIATSASIPAGSYPITVTATGGGVTRTTGFSLAITTTTTPPPTQPPSSSGDTDFQVRCSAPGILVCKGFDNASDFAIAIWPNSGLYPSNNQTGPVEGFQDTAVKASGNSSLRFEIHGLTGQDPTGFWRQAFGQSFGQNSTFYVQYRVRFSPEMTNTDWWSLVGAQYKISIIHNSQSTCADTELTTFDRYSDDLPMMYTDCGSRTIVTNNGIPPYLMQQGDYNCPYGSISSTNCFIYQPNQWYTFYYKVSIGTWGQANSSIQAWVAPEGQPYKQWINMTSFTLYNAGPGPDYSHITLTNHMTGKNSSVNHPTAYTWYDELIVSTQPIAAPGGSSSSTQTPVPPSNLTLK
jgi:hypothetical protein